MLLFYQMNPLHLICDYVIDVHREGPEILSVQQRIPVDTFLIKRYFNGHLEAQ